MPRLLARRAATRTEQLEARVKARGELGEEVWSGGSSPILQGSGRLYLECGSQNRELETRVMEGEV